MDWWQRITTELAPHFVSPAHGAAFVIMLLSAGGLLVALIGPGYRGDAMIFKRVEVIFCAAILIMSVVGVLSIPNR